MQAHRTIVGWAAEPKNEQGKLFGLVAEGMYGQCLICCRTSFEDESWHIYGVQFTGKFYRLWQGTSKRCTPPKGGGLFKY